MAPLFVTREPGCFYWIRLFCWTRIRFLLAVERIFRLLASKKLLSHFGTRVFNLALFRCCLRPTDVKPAPTRAVYSFICLTSIFFTKDSRARCWNQNPQPQTFIPKPQTPNPKHQTPNPKLKTPNPKPKTPNSKRRGCQRWCQDGSARRTRVLSEFALQGYLPEFALQGKSSFSKQGSIVHFWWLLHVSVCAATGRGKTMKTKH